MAQSICVPPTGADAIITTYQLPGISTTRQAGTSFIGFARCDVNLADMTSPADWKAALDAGQIFLPPCGIVNISAPTSDVIETTSCGTKKVQSRTQTIDYTTYEFAEDCSDTNSWQKLVDQVDSWQVFLITCDGRFSLHYDAFSNLCSGITAQEGKNLGYPFSFTTEPYPDKQGNNKTLASWKFSIEVCPQKIWGDYFLDGVLAALTPTV